MERFCKMIEMIEWSAVTAILAVVGFFQWVVFTLLKSQFVLKTEFENHQVKCFSLVCKQIDELRQDLKAYRTDAEAKRDDAREKLSGQLTQIEKFMSRVEQRFHDQDTNGYGWGDKK